MENKPLVSICCTTYNHEKYIEEALKGFLMQETDFPFEILIHDDASTDNTANIIKEYEKKFPSIIKPIYQTENQYSQRKKCAELNYERVLGDYVAFCEGDDCWTDSKKLMKQVSSFKQNPEYNFSFHPALSINYLNGNEMVIGKYSNEKEAIIDINDVIIKKYDMIPTASCMLRKKVLKKVLEYKSTRPYLSVGDVYLQIFGSLEKGALYINDVMSIYRHFTPESWSLKQVNSFSNQIKHLKAMAKSYQELDEMTEYKYTKSFQLSTIKRLFSVTDCNCFEDFPKEFQLYAKKLKALLRDLDGSNYILYGAGVGSKIIINEISEKISFVIDRDESKNNLDFLGKKIKSLSQIKFKEDDKLIISLIGRSAEIQKELLEHYNLKKEQIIVFDKSLVDLELLKDLIFD